MDKRVVELIEALDRADDCREASAFDAVCHRCWDDVDLALSAVRNLYKPEELTGTLRTVTDRIPHTVL